MESKSPEKAEQKYPDPDIVAKIKRGQVATLIINEKELPSYLSAASATGFKVERIADEGEEYPRLSQVFEGGKIEQEYDSDGTPKVAKFKVQRKGYIAVSIESLEGSVSRKPFWDYLHPPYKDEPFPLKSTAKS